MSAVVSALVMRGAMLGMPLVKSRRIRRATKAAEGPVQARSKAVFFAVRLKRDPTSAIVGVFPQIMVARHMSDGQKLKPNHPQGKGAQCTRSSSVRLAHVAHWLMDTDDLGNGIGSFAPGHMGPCLGDRIRLFPRWTKKFVTRGAPAPTNRLGGKRMKKILILALLGGCTFGVDNNTETLDQGGIRVTPTRIEVESGSDSLAIDDVQFRNRTDLFSGEAPEMTLEFEFQGHSIELEAVQIERLTTAGGRTWLSVDGARQIVDVTTSIAGEIGADDYYDYGYSRSVELSFAFQPTPDAEMLQAVVSVDASFHCPPFDTRPAEVEDQPTPIL